MKQWITNGLVMIFAASQAAVAFAEGNRAMREGKKGYAVVEPIGLTLMPVSGIRGGYYISPDIAAEVGYATGGATIGSYQSKKTLIEAKGKYFVGDTFYVDGGLAYESWAVKYSVLSLNSTVNKTDMDAKVSNTGMTFHIGNQWQWDGFTLGCDWVGYFLSLSTNATFDSSGSLDADNKKIEEDAVKKSVGGSSVHITRLYLGWAF